MMARRTLPPLVKEIRALLPMWLACLAALACLAGARGWRLIDGGSAGGLGLFAYGGTAIALGAFSIGHEYSCRTLPQFLAQPRSRAGALLTKLVVLAAMLVTLAAAAWATVVFPSGPSALFVLAAVPLGLFVAPCLTMLSRNPLAGTVFTIVMAGLIWTLASALSGGQARFAAFAGGLQAVSAVAAVVCWVMFMRLEAIDGRQSHVHLRMNTEAEAPAPRKHPVWMLVKKDLGLQQLTFVVAGIYLLIAVTLATHTATGLRAEAVSTVTLLYSGMVAMLIGSLASAEERQLGTLEWQTLLPMATSTQWMAKAGTALTLSLALAYVLPVIVIAFSGRAVRTNEWYAAAVVLLTTGSLYVSSLSPSGLRAFMISPAVLVVAVAALGRVRPSFMLTPLAFVPMAGFLLVVLFLAMLNHRSAERGAWRICQQAFILIGSAVLGGSVLGLVEALRQHR